MPAEMTDRRFPPPWSIEELDECFIVRDADGQALGYFYFDEEQQSPAIALTYRPGVEAVRLTDQLSEDEKTTLTGATLSMCQSATIISLGRRDISFASAQRAFHREQGKWQSAGPRIVKVKAPFFVAQIVSRWSHPAGGPLAFE